jgi:hypothetical protein
MVPLQNYKINIPQYSNFYISPFSYIIDPLLQPHINQTLNCVQKYEGIFKLYNQQNLTPSTALRYMLNLEINKNKQLFEYQYINIINLNKIIQCKFKI